MNVYLYQNNTEKEVQNIYIGEYKEWTPWANTLWYYTFDDQNASQITDFSGNNRNLTWWSMPWYTLVSGTNYAGNFTTGSWLAPTNTSYWAMDWNSTVLAWVKPTGNGSWYVSSYSGSWPNQFALIRWYRNWQFEYFNQLGSTDLRTTIKSLVTLNNWYLIWYTKSWTSVKTYCNWVAWWTLTDGTNSNNKKFHIWSSDGWDRFQWQIGVLIVENRIWTADDFLNYYNQTKSNYWL